MRERYAQQAAASEPQGSERSSQNQERQSAAEEAVHALLNKKKYKEAEKLRVEKLPLVPDFREWSRGRLFCLWPP